MVKIKQTKSFTRNFKKLEKKHFPVSLIRNCVIAIISGDKKTLVKIKDHNLKGGWNGYREFHPARYGNYGASYDGWIVIYKYDHGELILTLVSTEDHDILKG
ncbi:type II toxin-antitoxin system YafQ family toxin [Companilactobacillus kimchiensis]|uniref:Addiction module toxin RelE n=1 Tax=Companilactobacillus kimchiensis TaxID=993692 RepID=A0A0R2LHR3_9LACO|nr:type II toxin-antitoxin system mRNA interferase toxin, RelE/StbE family [Companilactobacillus kimchiensis]KRN99084.1 hypothetical protein IV57_GL000509 [Companilactobacillus kimchiensis]